MNFKRRGGLASPSDNRIEYSNVGVKDVPPGICDSGHIGSAVFSAHITGQSPTAIKSRDSNAYRIVRRSVGAKSLQCNRL